MTLLYIGGDLPEEKAAARANLSIQDFRKSRAKLEKLKGLLGWDFGWKIMYFQDSLSTSYL